MSLIVKNGIPSSKSSSCTGRIENRSKLKFEFCLESTSESFDMSFAVLRSRFVVFYLFFVFKRPYDYSQVFSESALNWIYFELAKTGPGCLLDKFLQVQNTSN